MLNFIFTFFFNGKCYNSSRQKQSWPDFFFLLFHFNSFWSFFFYLCNLLSTFHSKHLFMNFSRKTKKNPSDISYLTFGNVKCGTELRIENKRKISLELSHFGFSSGFGCQLLITKCWSEISENQNIRYLISDLWNAQANNLIRIDSTVTKNTENDTGINEWSFNF